jgi:hypothetical protein
MATGITLLILVVFFLLSNLGVRESGHSALHRLMSGAVVLFHGMTMFSSRLVEEEHRFWYWTSLAWFVYLGLKWYDYPAMLFRFTMDNISNRYLGYQQGQAESAHCSCLFFTLLAKA